MAGGFGNQTDNGQKGLGDLDGSGVSGTTCQQVKFGAFTADAAAGCFLHGTGENSHLVVTGGEINLHGLRIIPEGNAKIIMDPKTLRLDTTGAVRVVVSNSLVGDITIWRGEIHRDLVERSGPGPTSSSSRSASTPRTSSASTWGGHRRAARERRRPHPGLAEAAAGVRRLRGQRGADLRQASAGLILDSLHIELGPVPLGALIINKVELDYFGAGDIWRGRGSVTVPAGGTLDATVEFQMGDFNGATFSFTPATPIPIGPFVYLLRIGGGFTVDPIHIEASARIGAGAAVQGTAPVNVNGAVRDGLPAERARANFKMSGTRRHLLLRDRQRLPAVPDRRLRGVRRPARAVLDRPAVPRGQHERLRRRGRRPVRGGAVRHGRDLHRHRAGAAVRGGRRRRRALERGLRRVREAQGRQGVHGRGALPVAGLRPGDTGQPGCGDLRPHHAHRDPLQHGRLPRAASATGFGARRAGRRHGRERAAGRTQPHDRADRQRRSAAGDGHWAGRRRRAQWRAAHGRRLHRDVREPAGHLPRADQPEAGRLDDRAEPGLAGDHADARVERLQGGDGQGVPRRQGPQALDQLPDQEPRPRTARGVRRARQVRHEHRRLDLEGAREAQVHDRRREGRPPERDRDGREGRPPDATARRSARYKAPPPVRPGEGQAPAGEAQGQERDRQVARGARGAALLGHAARPPRHLARPLWSAGRRARCASPMSAATRS